MSSLILAVLFLSSPKVPDPVSPQSYSGPSRSVERARPGKEAPSLPPRDLGLFVVDSSISHRNVKQANPAVAYDGHEYLVVWKDLRNYTGEIYGSRIDPAGRPLDSSSIRICDISDHLQLAPAVASGDSCFLVVWKDGRRSHSGDIYGCRVARDGRVLDPEGLLIVAVANGLDERIGVVAGDSGWLVVWSERRNDWDVRASRVSWSGVVRDPGGIVIAADSGNQAAPAVAFNGRDFLVVWQTHRTGMTMVRGARVNESGYVLDPGGVPIGGDASRRLNAVAPSIASDGDGYFVAWQCTTALSRLFGARLSSLGAVLGPAVRLAPRDVGEQLDPSVCFDGHNYLIAWKDGRNWSFDVYANIVSTEGLVRDSMGWAVASFPYDQSEPAAVGSGAGSLVVWTDEYLRSGFPVIRGQLLDTAGRAEGAIFRVPAPLSYLPQLLPAIAALDSGYLICWQNRDSVANPDIQGAILNRNAQLERRLTIAAGFLKESLPAVVAGESTFLVVYGDGRVCGKRVSRTGSLLDTSEIVMATTGANPDVVLGDSLFLVVWEVGGSHSDIRAARVTQEGGLHDPGGFAVTDVSDELHAPAVAFDGADFMAVWQDRTYGIRGARIALDGTVLDPDDGFFICYRRWGASDPDIVFDGTNCLVTWTTSGDVIEGIRVAPTGALVDSQPVWLSRGGEGMHAGSTIDAQLHSMVVAEDWQLSGLRGWRFGEGLTLIDSFSVQAQSGRLSAPALVCGGDGRVLLVCSGPAWLEGVRDTISRILAGFVTLPVGVAEPQLRDASGQGIRVWPNPFHERTHIVLGGRIRTPCPMTICDRTGRVLESVVALGQSPTTWDGSDSHGRRLPAGVYFLTVRTSHRVFSQALTKLE